MCGLGGGWLGHLGTVSDIAAAIENLRFAPAHRILAYLRIVGSRRLMYARSQRSRDKLNTAALTHSSANLIEDVSVSAVCRAADITRDTFHRHA